MFPTHNTHTHTHTQHTHILTHSHSHQFRMSWIYLSLCLSPSLSRATFSLWRHPNKLSSHHFFFWLFLFLRVHVSLLDDFWCFQCRSISFSRSQEGAREVFRFYSSIESALLCFMGRKLNALSLSPLSPFPLFGLRMFSEDYENILAFDLKTRNASRPPSLLVTLATPSPPDDSLLPSSRTPSIQVHFPFHPSFLNTALICFDDSFSFTFFIVRFICHILVPLISEQCASIWWMA